MDGQRHRGTATRAGTLLGGPLAAQGGNTSDSAVLARSLPEFAPAVAAVEGRLSRGLPLDEAREVEAWIAVSGGGRSRRSLAADAVTLELCRGMAGDRVELAFLRQLASEIHFSKETMDVARAACQGNAAALGPLYESAALREDRYALGQYFTPAPIAGFMARRVSEFGAERVFDPAVGAGALLAPLPVTTRVHGLDVSPICVALSLAGLIAGGFRDISVAQGDFLAQPKLRGEGVPATAAYDAVLCNPPYLRHHLLAKEEKRRLIAKYGAQLGVSFSALSTNYVYFFLEALAQLRPGGLLVFITPADFLDTRFGEGLKQALLSQLTIDEIILFDRGELAFAEVMTTSAITVARKCAPPARHYVEFSEAKLAEGGVGRCPCNRRLASALDPGERWSVYFGEREAALRELSQGRPRQLSDYVRVRRGIATGANDFFVISQATTEEWDIEPEYLLPVVASARDLPDGELSQAGWEATRNRGRPCWLLAVQDAPERIRGKKVERYLNYGAQQGVPLRFNCRTRNPWYRAENVLPPDIIITYMNRRQTRFVRNTAQCRVMSVFLNGYVRDPSTDVAALLAVLNAPETSSLIQKLGRTYGGGLGKIEPRELLALPMPNIPAVDLSRP